MGGARFGLEEGVLLFALQGIACYLSLARTEALRRPQPLISLVLLSFLAAFVAHIAAFAVLGRLLPGEELRLVRRIIVALVWAGVCGLVGWRLARGWPVGMKPGAYGLFMGLLSGIAYAAFMGVAAALVE